MRAVRAWNHAVFIQMVCLHLDVTGWSVHGTVSLFALQQAHGSRPELCSRPSALERNSRSARMEKTVK